VPERRQTSRTARAGAGTAHGAAAPKAAFDADISAFILTGPPERRRAIGEHGVICFHQKQGPNGCIVHGGDNRSGVGEGDDETLVIDLARVPAEATEIAVVATIYEGIQRGQDWSKLNAVVNLYATIALT